MSQKCNGAGISISLLYFFMSQKCAQVNSWLLLQHNSVLCMINPRKTVDLCIRGLGHQSCGKWKDSVYRETQSNTNLNKLELRIPYSSVSEKLNIILNKAIISFECLMTTYAKDWAQHVIWFVLIFNVQHEQVGKSNSRWICFILVYVRIHTTSYSKHTVIPRYTAQLHTPSMLAI